MSPNIDNSTLNVAADRVEDAEVPSRSFDNESPVDYDDDSSLPPTETSISTSSERMSHQFEDTASNEASYQQADVEIACGSLRSVENESEVDCDGDSSLLPTESPTSTSSEKMSHQLEDQALNEAAYQQADVEIACGSLRSVENESPVDYDNDSSLLPTETPISTSSEKMSCQIEDQALNEAAYQQADVEIACGSLRSVENESDVDCDDDSSLLPTESLTSTSSEKMSRQLEDKASNEAAYQQADVEIAFGSFRSVETESEAAYKCAWLSSLTPAVPKALQNEKWAMRPPFSMAALGCLSSFIVVSVRLVLDTKPVAYLLHSIVVLIDMLLIHSFTSSRWLSVGGEITTIIFFLAFHFTKETVFELLETTVIAMLCSFHLIASRNKHKEREEELEVGLTDFRRRSMVMLKTGPLQRAELGKFLQEEEEAEVSEPHNPTLRGSTRTWFVAAKDHKECRRHVLTLGEHFFEYFLDGSAGVMYTSFLGLIISELLAYGDDSKY